MSRASAPPLTVIDTHAGAGVYDLDSAEAARSGEATGGVGRLMADVEAPSVFAALKAAVRRANPEGGLRYYPGSPALAVDALRPGDHYIGAELHGPAANALRLALRGRGSGAIEVVEGDGYALAGSTPVHGGVLALIDPPFELGDDAERIALAVGALAARRADALVLVWTPLKDHESYDALLRRLEALRPSGLLSCQARLRPLDNPLRMNGCAVVAVGAWDRAFEAAAQAACAWVSAGGQNGAANVERLL